MQEQSRRHGYLLHLLGVKQVAVLVNKMDLVGYSADRFGQVAEEYRAYLRGLGVTPACIVPISAREGDNMVEHSSAMPWYQGPTVLQALDAFEYKELPTERPLRVPVQDVYKFDQRRIIVGRVESGTVRVGDEVVFSPSNKTAKIKTIEAWHVPEAPELAQAGQSIGVTLTEQIFVERGEVMSHLDHAPIESNVFKARLFWLGHKPLQLGKSYTLKLGTLEAPVTVEAIEHVIDTSDLSTKGADKVERNGAGEVVLRTKRMLALDEHVQNPITGRFVLVEDYLPLGGGIISMEGYPDQRQLITVRSTNITEVGHAVTREARSGRNGHKGAVLWFTGLSGSGKSTLALALERELFAKGFQVYVLDGDNIRAGLNANLGLQPRGPGREHPPGRRGRLPVRGCRLHRDQLVHLALPLRSRAGAGRGQGRVPRGLRQGVAGGVRGPRPEGALQACAQGRDPGIHRDQQPLRGARPARPGGADRRAAGRRVPGAADQVRRGPLPGLSCGSGCRRFRQPRSGSPRSPRTPDDPDRGACCRPRSCARRGTHPTWSRPRSRRRSARSCARRRGHGPRAPAP